MICLRPNRYLILPVVTALALLAVFATLLFGASTASAQGGAPEAPDKPTGTAVFRGGVDLEWNEVSGAESYEVQLYRNARWNDLPGDGVDIAFYGAGAIISGLNHTGFSYYFQVRANNAYGTSDWSEYLLMSSTSEYTSGKRDRPGNVPATGAPTVSGEVKAGETLTADTSGIADENGLDRVKFYYQWVSGEGAAAADIAGATGSSYTLANADAGKAVNVRVSFTDRGGYAESRSSAATGVATPTPPPPTPTPTPDPTAGICGRTQQVQDAILAELPEVSDCSAVTADDLRSFERDLVLKGADIAALRAGDFHGLFNLERLFLNFNDLSALPNGVFNDLSALVRLNLYGNDLSALPDGVFDGLSNLSFLDLDRNDLSALPDGVFDDLSNLRFLYLAQNDLSALPDGVFEGLYNLTDSHLSGNPAAPFTLTAELEQQADYAFVVKVAEGTPFDMDVTLSFRGAVQSGATVTVEGGSVRSLPVSVTPSGDRQPRVTVSVESAIFSKYNRSYATGVETGLGDDLTLPGESENTPATGAPSISGTAQVGETLTVDTSGIADADGLSDASFSYQWLSSRDTEIQGATGSTYTLVGADEGKIIKVRVSFTDDAGNQETLTSAATGAVEAATPQGICDRTRQVQDAILAWLPDVSDCSAVTDDDLKSIWGELRLNGTDIAAFQGVDFHGLSSLSYLFLNDNDLRELPDGVFDGLSNLERLDLAANALRELPDGVFDGLSSLEYLYLDENDLSELPDGVFDGLSSLEYLNISHNGLSALPGGMFEGLSSLAELHLYGNELSALPDGVFDGLSALEFLLLDSNELSALPDGVFDGLSSLAELRLYGNELSALPDGVFDGLSSLEYLFLEENELSALPDGVFDNLSSLEYLYLDENDLSELPDGVFDGLSNLYELNLSGNPGAPFTITAELEQQADYAFVVKIAEGAPFDMRVTLSFQGAAQEGATVTVEGGSVRSLPVSVTPSGTGQPRVTVSVESAVFRNPRVYFMVGVSYPYYATGVETGLGDDLILPGESENTPATGAPSISGTAQVGETLTAETSAITDADGLSNVTFSYQWLSSRDTEIQGATSSAYTLLAADEGKIIKVRVSFTDDAGNEESVESAATAAVAAAATSQGICGRTQQVQDAILARLPDVSDCSAVTDDDLRSIEGSLWLNGADITALQAVDFHGLSSLEELDIHDNDLSALPDGVFDGLSALEELYLNDNGLSALPEGVFDDLSSLGRLYLSDNDLSALPEGVFDGLASLRELSLSGNDLSELPDGMFDGHSNLGALYLDANDLSALPDGVFDDLSSLERLSLNDNGLSALPDGVFDDLSSLEELYLNDNDLSALPDGVFDDLSNLKELYLHRNDLSALPEGVFDDLSNLKELLLHRNGLSALPEGVFDDLSNLEELLLHRNGLSALPEGVFDGLSNLEVLYLNDNDLSALPEGVFDDLSALEVLLLIYNDLSALPDGVFEGLYDLEILGLSGNPGAPFTITAELEQQADYTFVVKITEGAPFDMDATLSFRGTAQSGATVTVEGGSVRSQPISVTPGGAGQPRVTVSVESAVFKNYNSSYTYGIKTGLGDDLILPRESANTPATGAPAISGTAQVGETLTADTSAIADQDGLQNVTFSYQWLSSRDTEIQGATGATYTLVEADEGKIIKVRVSFTDDAGNAETLTSVATGAVAAATAQGICDRTQQVQDAILARLPDVSDCSAVTGDDLRSVGTIRIRNQSLPLLQPGDFDGLSSLEWLHLDQNNLSELPDGVFDDLSNLERLYLYHNNLSELPDGVFDDLSSLEWLLLYNNNLSELPDGVFDDLSNLERLYLNYNDLSELPDGVFEGLYNLNVLGLSGNPEAPFTITAELEQQVGYGFVVKIAEGAPFDMEVTLSFQGATQEGAIVTVEGGSVRSLPISVTPSDAGQPRVTVSVESAVFQNYSSYFTDGISYPYPDYTTGVETGLGDDLILPGESENTPATGAPVISGTAQVGETLTADTSAIADADGLSGATFSYQWLGSGDTEIQGATGSTYTLVGADEGKIIKVRVSFTDDAGNQETLTSTATEAVAAEESQEPPPAPQSLTAVVNGDGSVSLSWEAPDNDSVTGYQILRRRPAAGEKTLLVYVEDTGSTATTHTDTDVTAGTQHVYRVKAINSAGLSGWSNYVNVTPAQPEPEPDQNTAATGAPAITGTARVGETLTADASGIADEDGLDNATFSYQWLADDADIDGATGYTHTLADADAGKTIKVRVSFSDDAGNEETLTSGATAAVQAAVAEEEPTEPPPAPTNLTAVVNEDGSVTLTWEAPDDDSVTGYLILRRRPYEGEKTLLVHVEDTGSTATTFTDTDVTAGTQHVYRVKAINDAGAGNQSNYVNVDP